VSWSTSDETLAPINAHGVLRAPNARGTVTVTARTPTNVTGSTGVTFVPVPTAIAAVLPIPSNVPPGAPIAALKALVTASDGLGVQGAPVHFQAVSGGGAVTTADVVTDSAGFAQTAATAGLTGTSVYAATTAGVAGSAIFNVTIAASGATQLAFTAPPTSGLAGIALPPVIVAVEDAQGQPVVTSSNQVTIALGANPGGATLSGTTTV
jgi:hypothetical protein